MEIEANPPVEIRPETFSVLVAPEETALSVLRSALGPRRFLFLYVCGNYSRLLSRINLRNAEFDARYYRRLLEKAWLEIEFAFDRLRSGSVQTSMSCLTGDRR